jgi:hypothetical protein
VYDSVLDPVVVLPSRAIVAQPAVTKGISIHRVGALRRVIDPLALEEPSIVGVVVLLIAATQPRLALALSRRLNARPASLSGTGEGRTKYRSNYILLN